MSSSGCGEGGEGSGDHGMGGGGGDGSGLKTGGYATASLRPRDATIGADMSASTPCSWEYEGDAWIRFECSDTPRGRHLLPSHMQTHAHAMAADPEGPVEFALTVAVSPSALRATSITVMVGMRMSAPRWSQERPSQP